MKKIITAFVFCFLCGECFSQAGEWVWIKGDSIPNQAGNYGVQGVPSPTNNPPSLYEPCEWTDLNGTFWMFGGLNLQTTSDLWKYDPLTNEWTWMKGPGIPNDPGNYGNLGVSSPANNPPSRGYGMASWVDNAGNLWMFGGSRSTGNFNDLWKYDILTNEWTWMKGANLPNQTGNYGLQGIADSSNIPGSRHECVAAWEDNSGDFWLFGGLNAGLSLNDLWRFNIASNQWTWMKGSQFPTPNPPGTYGILGIEDSINTPGGRCAYSHWKDNIGNFWLFGGWLYPNDYYNDLWRYNPVTNNWKWMGGDSVNNSSGNYGNKCTASSNSIPGARFENRAAWKDQLGNFWFFGGAEPYSLNDLWLYCFSTNEWIWQSGDSINSPTGFWGTIGVSSPNNKPRGKFGAVGWQDNNNHFYLFGGVGYNFDTYNDLWKFTIDTTCGVCPAPNSIQENNFSNDLLGFPNPTNSSLTISFSSSEKQIIELRIYNTLGKQIYVEKEEMKKGKFEKEIDVEKWSGGIYFLQVKIKEGNISRKVIVNH